MLHIMDNYSLYFHIPFCRKRCSYCDFNTYAGQESAVPAYVAALCTEIRQVAASAGRKLPVHTLFFGGGTPSLLSPASFRQIMREINENYDLLPDYEATLEANPGTVSLEALKQLADCGFNRISFGMQSADEQLLALLDRLHRVPEVVAAVDWAYQAGFHHLNLDLIFGIPYQTLQSWQDTLQVALAQHPDHLSLYALTLEKGTPLHELVEQGRVPEPDPDLAADMYDWAAGCLADAGYQQYEISNWAKDLGSDQYSYCRHNLQYWRNLPYLGFGAGAHGYAGGYRTADIPGIGAYIHSLSSVRQEPFPFSPANISRAAVDQHTEMQETMMVGLRLVQEGVSAQRFNERFGQPLHAVFGAEIDPLVKSGLLEWAGPQADVLRLTPHGRLLGNQVFLHFVGDGDEE
jgi:oxygen-independent coproporphyrinogen III oxidase